MKALRWVLALGRTGRGVLTLAVVMGALASGAAVGLSATAAWLISRAAEQPPVLHLMVAIVAVRAFGLSRGLFRYLERLAGHDASFRTLGDLRVATVRRLERVLPIRSGTDASHLSSGELLARFVNDVDSLQDLWVRVLLPYASTAIVALATSVLIVSLVPAAGAVLAGSLIGASLLAPLLAIRAAQGSIARLDPLRAEYETEFLELQRGAAELQVYGATSDRLDRLDHIGDAMRATEARSAFAAGAGAATASLMAGAAVWAALLLGSHAVRQGALSAVVLAVVVLVPLTAHELVAGLGPAAQRLPALKGSAERIRSVFTHPDAINEPFDPLHVPSEPAGLAVRDVHVQLSPESHPLFDGLDLDIAPGSRTVIAGPSGSGKSTLAALLLRLIEPTRGRIELVGPSGRVEYRNLLGDDIRAAVGWCAQDAYIFDSTLEANLQLANTAARRADLLEALRRARLLEWVETLPSGLDTRVGEHGKALSGGQRQRLALARVLLADRGIMIFDEPTEHLDEPTAVALASDLIEATVGRTVIVLTHRPDLFHGADQVLRIAGCKLVVER